MGPHILATDEIGTNKEVEVLHRALISGVQILTTIHGSDVSDVIQGPFAPLIRNRCISRMVFLTDIPRKGTISRIWKLECMEDFH